MERRRGIPLVPLVIFIALLVAIILVCTIILGLNKKNKKNVAVVPTTTPEVTQEPTTTEKPPEDEGEEITSEDILNEDEDIKNAYKLAGNGKTFAKYAIYASGGFDSDNDNIKNDLKLQLAVAQSSSENEISLEKMKEYADKIFENNEDLEFKDFSLYSSDTNFTDIYSTVGYIYNEETQNYEASKNEVEESTPSEITEVITKAVKYSDKLEIYVKPLYIQTFYSNEIEGMGCQLFQDYDYQKKEFKDSIIAIAYSDYDSILKSEYNRDLDHYKYSEINSNLDLNAITEYKYTFIKDENDNLKLKSFGEASKNTTDSTADKMNTQEVKTYNASFEEFEGNDVKGTQIKELLDTIMSSNETQEKNMKIELDGIEITDNISDSSSKITTSKTFTVEFDYDNEGYISKTKITTN